MTSLEFPALTTVEQTLSVESTFDVSLPALATSGIVSFSAQSPRAMSLPSLTTATAIIVSGPVTGIDLPELTSARSLLADGTSITELTLPSLTRVSELFVVASSKALTTISLPQLTTVQAVITDSNPILRSVSIPLATELGSDFRNNPALVECVGPFAQITAECND